MSSLATSVVQEDTRDIVRRVGGAFERLSGKNVLIAGGTGFIGSHLLETVAFLNDHVLKEPCRVFAAARNPDSFARRCPHLAQRSDILLVRGDVRTFNPPTDAWHFVIHAASPADPQTVVRNPLETMDVIVGGTRRMLSLASEKGKEVEKFLFLSSGAVYGPQPPEVKAIPENYQGGPDIRSERASYGEAKRYAEVLCQAFQVTRHVPVSVARLFAFVGPHMDLNASFAVMEFIRHGLFGEPIRVRGNGKAIRTFCYAADMAVALWNILLCGEKGEVYNVGSDRDAITIAELAGKVARKFSPPVEVILDPEATGDDLRPNYIPNIEKLKTKFRYTLEYSLDASLARTVEYFVKVYRDSDIAFRKEVR